jgi:glycosyltransferase involved in cell wall biosynthesis
MNTLSAVIITFNEAGKIEDCLRSVTWADEIIVVDSGSTDGTLDIARTFTDRVYVNAWPGYGAQKQYASSLVKSDWTLSIDADERVSEALRDELQAMLKLPDNPHVAYRVPIIDWMFGKVPRFGSWAHQAHIRLYRTGKMTWVGDVHEQTHIEGEIGQLKSALFHYSHTSIERFLFKLNKYTDLEAKEAFEQGRRVGLVSASFRAARAFLGQYVRLQGFRDGGHGLILASMMTFYEFIKHAKLWVLWYQHDHPEAREPRWK